MKFVIVFAICIATALAAPADDVSVVKLEIDDVRPDGYKFAFETSDGSKREEEASLDADNNLSVKGSFQYVAADGETYKVNFVADENGYRPEGAHIPVAAAKK